jgi:hypothetical protein
MATQGGIPLGEFMVIETIRAALGYPSTLQVVRWSRSTGAVVVELPRASRVAVPSETAAWEAAHTGRQPPTGPAGGLASA